MLTEPNSDTPASDQTATSLRDAPSPPSGENISSSARWWKRGLIAVGLLAIVGIAAALMPGGSSRGDGEYMTHTIKRGDLTVTVTEQGTLESSENTEIKCKVRGDSTVIWVVESGTYVEPGDELVRLDTLALEDAINERSKYALWSRSAAERSRANVRRSELAIEEYLDGRYKAELMTLEKDLAIAESRLRTAQNMRDHSKDMKERGYASDLEVEEREFAVTRAQLNVDYTKTQINILKEYTREMELEDLQGQLDAAKAKLEADEERAKMDGIRRDLAVEELEYCVMKAERAGLVIYPSAAVWKETPDIDEGATVHKDQVLLLMPDLSKMQVKVGIHESIIDRVKPGMNARITLPDRTLEGKVESVSEVTRPAGWWTGNVVKYDTIIKIDSVEGLKPGMSSEVEIIMAEYTDVLTVPVAAVVETDDGTFCWVDTDQGPQRRSVRLGDSNDVFIVVEAGLKEGDRVVLDPIAFIEEAQEEALDPGKSASSFEKMESPDAVADSAEVTNS